jgi:hypothetical protein
MTTQSKNYEDVVVTTVTGERFTKMYNRLFRESQERYVKKLNLNFVFITEFIEHSPRHSHVSWQKMLMFRHPQIAPYRRVLFIDADIYVTRHARNPFDIFGNSLWGEVDNNPYKITYLTQNDPKLYDFCPPENRPEIMLNGGVLIITKETSYIMEKVFYEFDEQPCYDNGPLSYYLLNTPGGTLLPTEFNTLVVAHQMAFGRGLSSLLSMYHESSFLHFAGGPMKSMPTLYIIRHIDTHPNSLVTKLIYFFGKKKYDFLTAPLLNTIRSVIGFYDYHVKKRFRLGDYKK